MGSAAIALLLIVGLSSCWPGNRDEGEQQSDSAPTEAPSDLKNLETNVQITVPEDWIAVGDSVRGSADIYATNQSRDLYASVLSESSDVLSQFDLENNAEQYRWLIQKKMDSNFKAVDRLGTTTINGMPAVQYEISGNVDGVPVVYLHTTVKGEDSYYQVVGWTTEDLYPENKDTLQQIVKSFRTS